MLSEANFKPVYATGENEPSEFFLEALLNSSAFDFGLGYFSSSGFRALSLGFAFFIKRGGKIRMIINDVLSTEDKDAISKGLNIDPSEVIESRLVENILSLQSVLSRKDHHFFNCLSWLIASKRLEIIATIPKNNKIGIVHQKFGIFSDLANNTLAFTGSINFSANALFNNVEAIWCDYSWMNNQLSSDRIKIFQSLFNKTWTGFSDSVDIIPIEKVKTTISALFPSSTINELVKEEIELIQHDIDNIVLPIEYLNKLNGLIKKLQPSTLQIKHKSELPKLREYQENAILRWKENNYRGILEMATGTGKTFTALSAIWELLWERKKLFVIISCPFIHLAEQWVEEAKKFGLDGLLIGESRHLWEDEAARQAALFKRGKMDKVVLITTNASFSSETFQKIIKTNIEDTLLIIDEVHYAGAYSMRKLLPSDCNFRLGLSATPERHGDSEGTEVLFDYFDSVVFSFPIEDAIGKYLTPYYYYAVPVEMTDEEFEEYCSLTEQIIWLSGKTDELSRTRLEKLSIKRARVQNNSLNKIEWLKRYIDTLPTEYSLFYAGDLIFNKIKFVLGKEKQLKIHEFTSRQSRAERKKLLEDFSSQKIQSLIAMKCLDEGVDIPPTRVAYFLASSSNPREFVQRRGRILRKYPGKENAIIYDLISIPPKQFIVSGRGGKHYHPTKTAFAKEYIRVLEFANMALNKYNSMDEIFKLADLLNLLDITR